MTLATDQHASASSRLFEFDNTYATRLDGFGAPWKPTDVAAPALIRLNDDLAVSLGVEPSSLQSDEAVAVLAGAATPNGAAPVAQAYAGHQFGGFNPQLGDGRAVLLGEIVSPAGERFDIALKGSGRTPFSRGGDGKAALGPVLREYLMGEAMHALGIPTTRALAAVTTGEMVRRETPLPGAVLTRVAASHIRVGTFQFFAARGDRDRLRQLADYSLQRHDPELVDADVPALALLDAVIERQAALVASWMNIGFIHGVMNTDNVTISGETIDYGPCAFMDAYDPSTVFSSIDTGGRYAYGNQPTIALWNLARLAEALLPLIDDDHERAAALATASLDRFADRYEHHRLTGMYAKLGLDGVADGDRELADDWLDLLQEHRVDLTTAFRRLADAADGTLASRVGVTSLFDAPVHEWLDRWSQRVMPDAGDAMRLANPIYVPRNHLVEEALTAATAGDMSIFDELFERVTHPFDEQPGAERFATPAPDGFNNGYRTFCGT